MPTRALFFVAGWSCHQWSKRNTVVLQPFPAGLCRPDVLGIWLQPQPVYNYDTNFCTTGNWVDAVHSRSDLTLNSFNLIHYSIPISS